MEPAKPAQDEDFSVPERRTGVGELLSKFYNLEDAEEKSPRRGSVDASSLTAVTKKHGGIVVDPLDSSDFDVKNWLEGNLSTLSLSEIMQNSKELSDRIRTLDGDVQMLVYENYSKFMSATETVRRMKINIEMMEGQMSSLTSRLSAINTGSERLNASLGKRPAQMEEMVELRNLLERIDSLRKLPVDLEELIKRGLYAEAVQKYFSLKKGMMMRGTENGSQDDNTSPFADTMRRSESLMSKIRRKARDELAASSSSHTTTMERSADLVRVLLLLGDKAEDLLSTFLEFSGGVTEDEHHGEEAEETSTTKTGSLFMAACENVAKSQIPAIRNVLVKSFELFTNELSETIYGSAIQNVVNVTVEKSGKHLAIVLLQQIRNDNSNHKGADSDENVIIRQQQFPELDDGSRLIDEALQHSSAHDSVHLLRTAWGRIHPRLARLVVLALFRKNSDLLSSQLLELHKTCSNGDAADASPAPSLLEKTLSICNHVEDSTVQLACRTMENLQQLMQSNALQRNSDDFDVLLALVLAEAEAVFIRFVSICVITAQSSDDDAEKMLLVSGSGANGCSTDNSFKKLEWNDYFALSLVRVARSFEKRGLKRLGMTISENFPNVPETCRLTQSQLAKLCKKVKSVTLSLLKAFAVRCGQRLSLLMRTSIYSPCWFSVRPPSDVRGVIEVFLKEVQKSDDLLARFLGDPRKPRGMDSMSICAPRSVVASRLLNKDRRSPIELEMERLLVRRSALMTTCPSNRQSTIAAALGVALKGTEEAVRQETFGKNGLQQFQIDLCFLAEQLRHSLEKDDLTAIDGVIDEVLSSAIGRCVDSDVELLSAATVQSICEEKAARLLMHHADDDSHHR